ncbi:MAG: response regulator transcription factor [Chitinophagaceae bacterium]|nr:response regulator transcription factor [Chitinophagaceae bacterium]
MNTKVLYIEDELHMARIVTETLALKGYEVLHKKDGTKILEHINQFQPDICVLDVMLPYIDGFSLGSAIRTLHAHLPIIFLTAKSQTQDVLDGFSAGGTDYLKKPFSMEELMVRINNQVNIYQRHTEPAPDTEFRLGSARFTPMRFLLETAKKSVKLSHKEVEILHYFCRHQQEVIDRRILMQMVWGDDSFFHSRNLDVYISKLRAYFEEIEGVEIFTLKGVGYRFVVQDL